MKRRLLTIALGAALVVALAGAPVFARGGGGGGRGGGGGGGRGGGGGGFRGGGGGGGVRGFSGGGARSFSAPRMPSYGGGRVGGYSAPRMPSYGAARMPSYGAARMPSYGAARMPSYGAARMPSYGAGRMTGNAYGAGRGFTPGRAPIAGNMAGRTGIAARSSVGNLGGGGNRANLGAARSFGNTLGNRPAGVVQNNRFNTFNRTNVGLYNAGYRGGAGLGYRGYGFGWRNPYFGFHQNWIHGYWGGFYPWGFGFGYPFGYGYGWGLGGFGFGLGYGLGWGLSTWPYGSALYGYGYTPYYNPYFIAPSATVVMVPYDYSQPINTTLAAPPAESATDEALGLFASARDAFQHGAYETALQQADQALAQTPNDTALHEFRALCLFALGRYDDAATALYAVLAVGPGWDWPTLISLYANPNVYTNQLRALESYCKSNPRSAPARFVLAYQYLTEGHLDAATQILRQVTALKPDDSLSAKLLKQIESAGSAAPGGAMPAPPVPGGAAVTPGGAPAAGPVEPPADVTPPAGATIQGTWTAHPQPDSTITLTVRPDNTFTWQVAQKGKTQQFTGTATFGSGILTLAQDKGPVLVGRLNWQDAQRMTFRIAGGGPEDPGLGFSK